MISKFHIRVYKGSEVFKKIDERLDINKYLLKNNLTKLKDEDRN